MRVGRLVASAGLNHVFSGLLRAVADTLEALDGDQLRPMELAVTEFLLACLSDEFPNQQSPETLRRAQLHRVQQTIERLLAEPDLSLARVAAVEGVSARHLQRLFSATGGNFTRYVRSRRLETLPAVDLVSARYAEGSISSICFRWGFNGSPHFGRVSPSVRRLAARVSANAARRDRRGSGFLLSSTLRSKPMEFGIFSNGLPFPHQRWPDLRRRHRRDRAG